VTERLAGFREEYEAALRGYLEAPGEAGLQAAYELGRRAIHAGLSVLDLASAHEEVLVEALRGVSDALGAIESEIVAIGAHAFLRESLSPFDMASRGFREASETARLQREHTDRLRRLADAFLAVTRTLSVDGLLDAVIKEAQEIVGATSARLVVELTGEEEPPWEIQASSGEAMELHETLIAEAVATGRAVRRSRVLAVPLLGRRGSAFGVVQLGGAPGKAFTDADEAVLVQLATMGALAVENAILYEREHQIAATLQQSLLPESLPERAGVELCQRYVAGGEGMAVGGDFYDVIDLPDGRLGFAIGDVMGKGVHAAATMGQVRLGLRAYALSGESPVAVFDALDRLLTSASGDTFATAAYLLWDPATDTARFTNAGHPPPLVRTADGTVELLEGGLSPPLGLWSAGARQEAYVPLEPGSTVLLFTDGLVEDRAMPISDGLERLRSLLAAADPSEGVEALCDGLLVGMEAGSRRDDLAILAFRVLER